MPDVGEKVVYRSLILRQSWPAVVTADRGDGRVDLEVLTPAGDLATVATLVPRGDGPGTWAPAEGG